MDKEHIVTSTKVAYEGRLFFGYYTVKATQDTLSVSTDDKLLAFSPILKFLLFANLFYFIR